MFRSPVHPLNTPAHLRTPQHISACSCTLRHVLEHPSTPQHVPAHSSIALHTQHTPACPCTPKHIPAHPSTSLHTPVHPSTPQHTPAHPTTLSSPKAIPQKPAVVSEKMKVSVLCAANFQGVAGAFLCFLCWKESDFFLTGGSSSSFPILVERRGNPFSSGRREHFHS